MYINFLAASGTWRDVLIANPIIPVQVGECVIQRFTKCRGVNLDSVLLIRADFRGADLSGANLTNAILYRADLRNIFYASLQSYVTRNTRE